MKKLLFAIPILALAATAFLPPSTASADVYVNGYDRSDGTYRSRGVFAEELTFT